MYQGKLFLPLSTCVAVTGRKVIKQLNSVTKSYAIEFVKWENWLIIELAPETIANFNELEIIAHCLCEMTSCGYEQDQIP